MSFTPQPSSSQLLLHESLMEATGELGLVHILVTIDSLERLQGEQEPPAIAAQVRHRVQVSHM